MIKSRGKEFPSAKAPGNKKKGVDIDFGQLGMGGLFQGIGNFIDLAAKLGKETKEIKGELKGLGKEVKGVYGFRIRTLAGEEPKIETFGNIKKTKAGPVVEEEREPLTDVFDEKKEIRVIAELPGVEKSEIQTEIKGDILKIFTTGEKKYSKEILLPCLVNAKNLSYSYNNGILEVRIKKLK